MPKAVIKKRSQIAATEAYNRVKGLLANDKDLHKLDPSYKCHFNDSALTGTASGKMFKAEMTIKNEGGGSEVEIIVDLPFTLALAKGLVQKTLQKKLDESLA